MQRFFYSSPLAGFLDASETDILGTLAAHNEFPLQPAQRDAWLEEIRILKATLGVYRNAGTIYLEYSIPRLGRRIDAVVLIGSAIFVLEFKVGGREFAAHAIDQVWDYALDLKNFHEPSHEAIIAPVLVATEAKVITPPKEVPLPPDHLFKPFCSNSQALPGLLRTVLRVAQAEQIAADKWAAGRYHPTPTIVEAAMALYSGHGVTEISRSDAAAINLGRTAEVIGRIITDARDRRHKAICFVTGVPGAGKTLVGLNIATKYIDKNNDLYSVFLSGNGPLVNVLREALARDQVRRGRERGQCTRKGRALSEVKMFIQNVHNFRDDCLSSPDRPPLEHVALFDEAQRAWNREHTSDFMRRRRKRTNFNRSEPEYLISCLDRHQDWAVIVCLVGGGQEINTGEAGISEWIDSLEAEFASWHVYISSRLTDSEYAAGGVLDRLRSRPNVTVNDDLHLAVSMRSFRAENVSLWVKQILDLDTEPARRTLTQVGGRYPIALTRDLNRAKTWLRHHARGSERYGIVVSSRAERLRPYAIDVKSPMDPVHWFLDGKEDVRSSYYLEEVATEFDVQGLELDWACVAWDGDFRHTVSGWEYWSFCGDRWTSIRKPERQRYLKNAYRVLLTRARQGMVIVVPEGDRSDPTRQCGYYDPTFNYLCEMGLEMI